MKIDFSRLAAEFVIIVVGILVALAADSAWEDRSNRIQEKEELARLHQEFQGEFDFDSREIEYFREQVVTLEELLALLQSAPLDDMVVVPDALALEMLYQPTWDTALPVLNSLINSGRLRLISSADVREAINMLQISLINTRENQERSRAFYVNQLLPILRESGDITKLLNSRRGYAHRDAQGETRLKNSIELQNAVAEKILWVDLARDTSERAVRRLGRAIQEIEKAR